MVWHHVSCSAARLNQKIDKNMKHKQNMKPEIAEYIQNEFDGLLTIHPKSWLNQFHQIRGMLYAFAAIGEISDQELMANLNKLDAETVED